MPRITNLRTQCPNRPEGESHLWEGHDTETKCWACGELFESKWVDADRTNDDLELGTQVPGHTRTETHDVMTIPGFRIMRNLADEEE